MKFKDVKEHTWVKYLGDYFFVRYVEHNECYLENEFDEIELTADDFETYHIEPVEAPTFKPGDQVLVVSKMIGNLYQQITTIIEVEEPEHQTFPYGLDMGHKYMRAWATPFQIQKLDY